MINKLIILLVLVSSSAFAQNSVQVASIKRTVALTYEKGKFYYYSKFVHPYDFYFDQKIREYEERMVALVKKRKKIAKLMQKPQYADLSYFGHKRKPKKRPLGKRKFCKECEIVH